MYLSTTRWFYNELSVCTQLRRIRGSDSGVTRVGVTRDGNWWRHPYFFPEKNLTTFLVIAVCKVITFLAVRPRLSTVLSKCSHILKIHSGCHPLEGVTRGGPPPPPLSLVTPLFAVDGDRRRKLKTCIMPLSFIATFTLISQTAKRLPIRRISRVGSYSSGMGARRHGQGGHLPSPENFVKCLVCLLYTSPSPRD